MRVLHTSDWHLGRLLYGKKRHHEFSAFLDWLLEQVTSQHVDVLLVAGDIFDTNTPGNQAQQLYYHFLARLAGTCCRHMVVIGGNHDSPSFLDAPQQLLKALNVHVVGEACDDPADEVIALAQGDELELLVCAVPYLRERDLRRVEDNETMADKEEKVIQAVARHYQAAADYAESLRNERDIPLIGMGHLFTTGGQLQEGDGVRDLYVGSLGQVPADVFPASFDYLALGHLHVPQLVAGQVHMRYCGSPVAMGFGEVGQQKHVVLIDFDGRKRDITTLNVPVFQQKVRIKGDLNQIQAELEQLVAGQNDVWVELEYDGEDNIQDLSQRLESHIENSKVSILRVRNHSARRHALRRNITEESLAELTPEDVFSRRLALSELSETEGQRLTQMHRQILRELAEEDTHANS
ncbi:MAG: exonuclease SbcCD subunit D C-terminal domain-containing protein [Idiomarina sp.]|nr:exonuclease SbcCD subunit D C-terminal domain-containing protein [Idiomarina sp.]